MQRLAGAQVRAPVEFQGTIIGDLNRRKGVILNSDSEADEVVMQAQARPQGLPLRHCFEHMPGCLKRLQAPQCI